MRKLVYATAAAAVGLGLPIATATAAAADTGDQPLVSALSGSCLVPSVLDSRVVTSVTGPEPNCDGTVVAKPTGELAGVLDNSCIAPAVPDPQDVGAMLFRQADGTLGGCNRDVVAAPQYIHPLETSDSDLGALGAVTEFGDMGLVD